MSESLRFEVEAGTPEAVAYRLMQKIGEEEKGEELHEKRGRKYWLDLYTQCIKITKLKG